MAEMTSTTDWRPGMTVELDGAPTLVLESNHVKPGKGPAFVRARLKNLQSGAIYERTFRSAEKIPAALVERRDMQFLYEADGEYHLMDKESYEQFPVRAEAIGDQRRFLQENMAILVTTYKGGIVDVELPTTIETEVASTEPGIKGDTAQGATKPATLETGYTVRVPLFVNIGDRLVIDTRSGNYISRA